MSARIRYADAAGQSFVATIERLSDGMGWDGVGFSTGAPRQITLVPSKAPWLGRYDATIPTPGWADGNYAVNVHRNFSNGLGPVIAVLPLTMYAGDDAPPPPAVVTINVPTGTVVNRPV